MRIRALGTSAALGILSAGLAAPALAGTMLSLGDETLSQEECRGYVVRVTGKDPVVVGGRLIGHTSDATDWRECKDKNGAGFYTRASGTARFVGNRLSNVGTDGYRIASAFDSVTFDRISADRIRDDVFSIARRPGTRVVIRHSTVRGYAILSSRNTGEGRNAPYSLDIDGLVAENVPYTIGRANRRDGKVFKLDAFRGTKKTWRIRNSVFLVHRGTRIDTPDATWENVTFVYADGGEFPLWDGGRSAPHGVRITDDIGVYTRAYAGRAGRQADCPNPADLDVPAAPPAVPASETSTSAPGGRWTECARPRRRRGSSRRPAWLGSRPAVASKITANYPLGAFDHRT